MPIPYRPLRISSLFAAAIMTEIIEAIEAVHEGAAER